MMRQEARKQDEKFNANLDDHDGQHDLAIVFVQ